MLGENAFERHPAGGVEERFAVVVNRVDVSRAGMVVEAELGERSALFLPGPAAQVSAVEGEQVEGDERGRDVIDPVAGPPCVGQSEAEAVERRSPIAICADDLAVQDGAPGVERTAQAGEFREGVGMVPVASAGQPEPPAV
jgi:hypothetical protein